MEHYQSHNPTNAELLDDSEQLDKQNSIINDLLQADLNNESHRVSGLIDQLRKTTSQRRQNQQPKKSENAAVIRDGGEDPALRAGRRGTSRDGTLKVSSDDQSQRHMSADGNINIGGQSAEMMQKLQGIESASFHVAS